MKHFWSRVRGRERVSTIRFGHFTDKGKRGVFQKRSFYGCQIYGN